MLPEPAPAEPPRARREEPEAPAALPYRDNEGWSALGMTKGQAADWIFDHPDRLAAQLAYVRAAAALNPALEPLSRAFALAADDPAQEQDYSVNSLLLTLGELDPEYAVFNSLAMAAAALRCAFTTRAAGDDYSLGSMRDSIDAFRELPALQDAFELMQGFCRDNDTSLDDVAAYRGESSGDGMEPLLQRAAALYRDHILTQPRDDGGSKRVFLTRCVVFAKDGYLGRTLGRMQENTAAARAALEADRTEFARRFVLSGKPVEPDCLSQAKLEAFMDDCWDEAGRGLPGASMSERLTGTRRNNMRTILRNLLQTIAGWYQLAEQTSPALEAGRRACRALQPRLTERLEELERACAAPEQDPQRRAGLVLLGRTARELARKLRGEWHENERSLLYADFLRTDWVQLDGEFLPRLDSTLCALPDFNILARIRAHVMDPGMEPAEHLLAIYKPDLEGDDYATGELLQRWLQITGGELPALPEDEERYRRHSAAQAKGRLQGFHGEYAQAQSRGRIMMNDSFLVGMEDTVQSWYADCCTSGNYGFFFRLVDACLRKIHMVAAPYEKELYRQLEVLRTEGAPGYFADHPGTAEVIRKRIREQNFTAAEDLMNRIRKGDWNLLKIEQQDMEHLQAFWAEYPDHYDRVCDNGTALRTSIVRASYAAKDRRGAEELVENWPMGLGRNRTDRIARLLKTLGWANLRVEPCASPVDKSDAFRVTCEDKPAGAWNVRHPIAPFGSGMVRDGFHVVCLYGTINAAGLLTQFRALEALRGPKLVLVDYALPSAERHRLARAVKRKDSGVNALCLVLDRVLLCYLANHYNELAVNRTLMAVGMPFAFHQPYVPDSVNLLPDEMFIGRQSELAQIVRPDGVNLVYGGRQLGKSALLKKACRDTDRNQGSRAVYVDLKTARTVGEAALALSRALVMQRILPKGSETTDWDTLAYAVRTRLMALEEDQEPIAYLLVLLDEADGFIVDSAACGYQPIDLLKGIQQDLPGQFKFVLAGLHNVVRFKRRQALGANSGIPHLPFLNVTPFDSDEALSLLTGPLGFLGFALENEDLASEILATTNYFPGLIQLYGKKLVESIRDEDYADYSEGETPPYVITDDHLRHVLSDSDFVKELRSKLEMTLRLDEEEEGGGYYEAIALLIAGRDHTDQEEGGYSAEQIYNDGMSSLPRRMAGLKMEQVATLLEELCDLNILRELGQGTYVFASKRFRDLMGTADDIFARMEELEEEG
ncbi:MAG: hypothetical protein IJ484_04145 [Oscillospiraceae bacterium]|nr:hypothetical protein [Oscillospiraceae bacterium]